MRILVTGSAGLLGSKIVEKLVKKGYDIYASYSKHEPTNGNPIRIDITNEDDVEKAFKISKPDIIIHAAALTNVDECEINKELAWKVNVTGTKNIVNLSKQYNAFLIYISTDYVFNGEKGMYKEDDTPDPINYYGLTKLKGEEEVMRLNNHSIIRSSVIYGSTPAAGKINFALWIIENLEKNKEIKIVTDQWNSPTLNTNLADMIIEILERRLTGIYHLAGATRISRYDFAKLIAKTFNLNENLIIPITSDKIQWTAKRPKDSSLNVSKASKTLTNKPLEITEALKMLKKSKHNSPKFYN